MKKQKISFRQFFIPIIFLAIFFVLGYIWKSFNNYDYFKLKEIVYGNIIDAKKVNLSYLIGKNIFSIDLEKELEFVLGLFPQYYKVRLTRVLPNRLFVDFLRRSPMAVLNQCRNFTFDDSGALFYFDSSSAQPLAGMPLRTGALAGAVGEDLELPVIAGLEKKILRPKPGQRYDFKELILALNIIKIARADKIVKNFKIKKIDVASPFSASIFFSRQELLAAPLAFEVKIGYGNIKDKLNILSDLVMQGKNELDKIEYFDLRFKEPVVKLRNIALSVKK